MEFENRSEILKLWMDKIFEDTIRFGEFILDQHPNTFGTEIISKLQILQNKITHGERIFMNKSEMDEFQHQVIGFYAGWNDEISRQSIAFYNMNAQLANQINSFLFDKKDHPFKKLIDDLDRYSKASETITEILRTYDAKMVNKVEFYSILFTIIVMKESVEYFFYDVIKRHAKETLMDDGIVEEMFSVTKKWKNKDGVFQPDITMMRNAIAHFKFDIKYETPPDEFKITFFPHPEGYEETRWFYSTDLLKFIGNYRNLLTTFEHIQILMMTFSLLNHFQSLNMI